MIIYPTMSLSELEEWSQQPLEDHNTLGEVPRDLFEGVVRGG